MSRLRNYSKSFLYLLFFFIGLISTPLWCNLQAEFNKASAKEEKIYVSPEQIRLLSKLHLFAKIALFDISKTYFFGHVFTHCPQK